MQGAGASPRELGLDVGFFQTNHEGEYCEWLHRAGESADGLMLNPGAWTHYSWAIRDALEVAGLPAVEVHLSAVDEREEWRRVSVIRDLCVGACRARASDGYREALEMLKEELQVNVEARAVEARADRLVALLARARARLPARHRTS